VLEHVVAMAEAKSKLAELVGQVRYGGNRYILERRGQPMAMLISSNSQFGAFATDATD